MSKHQTAKRKKLIKTPGEPTVKKVQAPLETRGMNSMCNWLILLILMMPILYSTDVMDAALVPRYIVLGGFLFLFTLYFLFLRSQNITFSTEKLIKMVFGAAIGYGLWSIISLFFAINPIEGYYEVFRHFLNIILLLAITVAVREESNAPLKLCKALTVMAIIQSFVGILQYYDLGFNYIPGNYKPYGLMANRNLFGSGQLYLLPFAIFVLHQGSKVWKYISAIAITGLIASILLSQTRSAWLGTAIFFAVSIILVSIFSPKERKKWLVGSAVSLAVLVALASLVLFANPEGTLAHTIKERAISMTQMKESTAAGSASIKERLTLWRNSSKMTLEHPVFGVGVGNWKIVILKYGTEGTSGITGKYLPDRPHNVYLLVASETGLPGAILFIGMCVLIVAAGFKAIVRSQSDAQKAGLILMLAGLGAIATDSFFGFSSERIEHTLYILITAGIILGTYVRSLTQERQLQRAMQKRSGVLMLMVVAVNLVMGITKYSFEKHAGAALFFNNAARYQDTISEVEAGKSFLVTLNPYGLPLEFYSSEAYRMLKQYDKALEESNKAIAYHPYSAKVMITLGNVYTNMGQFDKAIPVYEKARSITPEDEAILKNLAINYYQVGKYKETVSILDKLKIGSGDAQFGPMYHAAKNSLTAAGQQPR